MRELAQRLFHVRSEQLDIKFIFDHFRNYLICGALFYAGMLLAARGAVVVKIPHFGLLVGWLLQWLAFTLFALNFTHGMFAVRAVSDRSWNRWLLALLTVLLFFAMQELVAVP